MPKRLSDETVDDGRAPVSPRAAAVVFALLVLATVGAFAYAQRLKRDPLVLDRVSFVGAPRGKQETPRHSFTPNGDCRHDLMRIRFRTTISAQGTVQVIKPGGRVVITLARDQFLKRYTFHTYYWNGRQRGGETARRGRYKLRVKLGDRVLVTPGVIRLHRSPTHARSKC
jgi:translation initiation factor IF-1